MIEILSYITLVVCLVIIYVSIAALVGAAHYRLNQKYYFTPTYWEDSDRMLISGAWPFSIPCILIGLLAWYTMKPFVWLAFKFYKKASGNE